MKKSAILLLVISLVAGCGKSNNITKPPSFEKTTAEHNAANQTALTTPASSGVKKLKKRIDWITIGVSLAASAVIYWAERDTFTSLSYEQEQIMTAVGIVILPIAIGANILNKVIWPNTKKKDTHDNSKT